MGKLKFKQYLEQAIANIFAAKMRSFLAILGILVGTASVVALVSSGQMATDKALAQFKDLGTDLLSIALYQRSPGQKNTASQTLSLNDIHTLNQQIPDIITSAPYTTLFMPIVFKGHVLKGSVIGTDQQLQSVINIQLQQGHFVSFLDSYEKFCVIGKNLAEQIRQITMDNVIGQQIWLGKQVYTIIGVANPWDENAFFNQNINNTVIIPLRGSTLLNKQAGINNIVFKLQQDADIDNVIHQIKTSIHRLNPDLQLFSRSPKQIIESRQKQGKIFTLLLGSIGSIALLVGGIGVMNVMLVSVTERRREIGIRMAIGARRKDIRHLFLSESIVLALFGGLIGIILGSLISMFIGYFAQWDFHFYLLPPVIGFFVSVITGVFFGFYPAHRASKLNPIETLRYD